MKKNKDYDYSMNDSLKKELIDQLKISTSFLLYEILVFLKEGLENESIIDTGKVMPLIEKIKNHLK